MTGYEFGAQQSTEMLRNQVEASNWAERMSAEQLAKRLMQHAAQKAGKS